MSFIDDIKKCVHSKCEIVGLERNFLVEKKIKQPLKIQLQTEGTYLLYDFEKLPEIFPFFAKTADSKGLNAIADYVVFTEKNGMLWAIIVELKKKDGDPRNQLYATKQFVKYIVESVNRQCKKEYKIELRGIAHSTLTRPKTSSKKPYDINNNTFVNVKKLNLSNFLI